PTLFRSVVLCMDDDTERLGRYSDLPQQFGRPAIQRHVVRLVPRATGVVAVGVAHEPDTDAVLAQGANELAHLPRRAIIGPLIPARVVWWHPAKDGGQELGGR